MTFVTTKDGSSIFYKDWGPKSAQPIVFHHGWPLSSDDWDAQMLFFLAQGYRVVAHDRRGHGRSSQVSDGHDMDHYAADASAVAEHLNLMNAVHIGHSTGGGEVARYVARYGQPQGRVAKAVLVSAVPPLMVKTESNPGGTPIEVFDGFRKAKPQLASVMIPVMEAYPETARRVRAMEIPLALPVIDIVAEKTWADTPEELAAMRRAHADFVAASPAREAVFAQGSGHYVMHDRPQVVIDAVERMVKRVSPK